MKSLFLFFCVLLFSACSTTEQAATDITPPQLLAQYPFPVIPERTARSGSKIEMKVLITENGAVRFVELLNPTGNSTWDSLLCESIKQWKYAPAYFQNKPIRIWVRQTAVIQYAEPILMTLGEIVCVSPDAADSALKMLQAGLQFSEVVQQFSVALTKSSNGIIGEVNIRLYPREIQKALSELKYEQYSQPIRYGEHFVIFKRIKDQKTM